MDRSERALLGRILLREPASIERYCEWLTAKGRSADVVDWEESSSPLTKAFHLLDPTSAARTYIVLKPKDAGYLLNVEEAVATAKLLTLQTGVEFAVVAHPLDPTQPAVAINNRWLATPGIRRPKPASMC